MYFEQAKYKAGDHPDGSAFRGPEINWNVAPRVLGGAPRFQGQYNLHGAYRQQPRMADNLLKYVLQLILRKHTSLGGGDPAAWPSPAELAAWPEPADLASQSPPNDQSACAGGTFFCSPLLADRPDRVRGLARNGILVNQIIHDSIGEVIDQADAEGGSRAAYPPPRWGVGSWYAGGSWRPTDGFLDPYDGMAANTSAGLVDVDGSVLYDRPSTRPLGPAGPWHQVWIDLHGLRGPTTAAGTPREPMSALEILALHPLHRREVKALRALRGLQGLIMQKVDSKIRDAVATFKKVRLLDQVNLGVVEPPAPATPYVSYFGDERHNLDRKILGFVRGDELVLHGSERGLRGGRRKTRRKYRRKSRRKAKSKRISKPKRSRSKRI